MKTTISPTCIKIWVSARETSEWASKPGARWPCSQLSGRRFFAEFDRKGLCAFDIDGGRGPQDVDANELNAICADILLRKLPRSHPAWFVTVGQFLELGIANQAKPDDLAQWSFRIRRPQGDLTGYHFGSCLDCERAALSALGVPF